MFNRTIFAAAEIQDIERSCIALPRCHNCERSYVRLQWSDIN